jgi:YD repeat-containing protein
MGSAYVSDAEVSDRLERIVDPEGKFAGWRLVTARAEEVERYDVNGRLQSVSNRAGMAVTLSYSGLDTPPATAPHQGLLIRIDDAFGRSLSLRYDAAGRIGAATDPAGTETLLAYDGLGNLVTLTFPGLRSKTFHFESAAFPAALTGITDENGARYATYAYDAQGRAILSEHAGGAEEPNVVLVPGHRVTTFVRTRLGMDVRLRATRRIPEQLGERRGTLLASTRADARRERHR